MPIKPRDTRAPFTCWSRDSASPFLAGSLPAEPHRREGRSGGSLASPGAAGLSPTCVCCAGGRVPTLLSRPLSRTPWDCVYYRFVGRQTCNVIPSGAGVAGTGPCQPGGSSGSAGSHRPVNNPHWGSKQGERITTDSGSTLLTPPATHSWYWSQPEASATARKPLWKSGDPPKKSHRAQANQGCEPSLQSHTPVLPHTYTCLYLHYFCQNIWDGTSLKWLVFPFPRALLICIRDYLIIWALNIYS